MFGWLTQFFNHRNLKKIKAQMSIYNLSRVKKWGDHVPEGVHKTNVALPNSISKRAPAFARIVIWATILGTLCRYLMEEVVFSPLPETEFAITATSQSKGS